MPYRLLHPDGTVTSLAAAMDPAHDPLYASLPRLSFMQCLPYLSYPNEPSWLNPRAGSRYMDNATSAGSFSGAAALNVSDASSGGAGGGGAAGGRWAVVQGDYMGA